VDIISSRFQKALTERIVEARNARIESIGMGMATTFDEYKRQSGTVQGFNETLQMIEDIERELNAEK
jgi:hypothetical protein